MNLAFEAGRLAQRRGWESVQLVLPESLDSVSPGPGELIVLAPEGTFSVRHARDVAALCASGKSVTVVSPVVLAEDVQAWLPEDSLYTPDPAGVDALAMPGRIQLLQQVLRGLAADPDPAVRRIVARRPEAPEDLLRLLADDPDPATRWIVAQSQATPVDVLSKLLDDSDASVAACAASNVSTPIGPSQSMMRQVAEDCRRRIAEGSDDDDAWETLEGIAQDPSLAVSRGGG